MPNTSNVVNGDVRVSVSVRTFNELEREFARKLDPVFRELGERGRQIAFQKSPVDTGNNRNKIGWAFSALGETGYSALLTSEGVEPPPPNASGRTSVNVLLASTSGYGGFLEKGTIKMAARPYLEPAMQIIGREMADNLRGVF